MKHKECLIKNVSLFGIVIDNLPFHKWEVAHQEPSFEVVDVTSHLVKQFNPGEQALKWIEDGQSQVPIPIEEITFDID